MLTAESETDTRIVFIFLINKITDLKNEPLSIQEKESVDFFVRKWKELNLPEEELIDAVYHAFCKPNIKHPFAYFCGILKRIIDRTRRGSLNETVAHKGRFPWSPN